MADNVAITAGAGTTIATDDAGGAHFQRVKLVDGTLDSTAAIPGDATNGLDVDVTRLPALVAGSAGGLGLLRARERGQQPVRSPIGRHRDRRNDRVLEAAVSELVMP